MHFWWTGSRFGETKTGSATSANEMEIEGGVIRGHVFGEADIQPFTDFCMD